MAHNQRRVILSLGNSLREETLLLVGNQRAGPFPLSKCVCM